mgnify:CR=1 FL=1
MTPNQMIAMLRRYISDEQATGFTSGGNMEQPEGTQELLSYLDRAVDEYSKRQALTGDLRLLRTLKFEGKPLLPSDFLSLCGAVPITVSDKIITYYGDTPEVPIRYFARLPYVSDYGMDSELPYEVDQSTGIISLAAVYALNKQEYNVAQDLMLLGYGGGVNGNVEQ